MAQLDGSNMKSNKSFAIGILIATFAFLAIAAFPPTWNSGQFRSTGGVFSHLPGGNLGTNMTLFGGGALTLTNSSTLAFNLFAGSGGGISQTYDFGGGADEWAFSVDANTFTFANSANTPLTMYQNSFVEFSTAITNRGSYHGFGPLTNLNDIWQKANGMSTYHYFDTPAGDVLGSGAVWTRSATPKWWLINQDATSTEDLTMLSQTLTAVTTWKTNGTFQANNQLSVGSYSYTISTNLTTPGNTATTMFSVPVPSGSAVTISALVTGSQTSSANGGGYYVIASGSNNGGTTAIISTLTTVSEKESIAATVAIDFDDTSDTGRLRITGVAATEIKWGALITVVISE